VLSTDESLYGASALSPPAAPAEHCLRKQGREWVREDSGFRQVEAAQPLLLVIRWL